MTSLTIAYAGLGNMGTESSRHLAQYAAEHNHKLVVWNRSQAKYAELKSYIPGATFAADIAEIAAADIIFMGLLNDTADKAVVEQLLATAKAGTIIVDQSSVHPKTSIELEKACSAKDVSYLAAPVFGRPDAAKAGKLIQVVAGDPEAITKVRPFFAPISRAVLVIGDEVFKATTLKLMGNALIVGVIELLAETYALGDAVGIDPNVFQEFIEMFFPTPSYVAYGKKVGQGNFDSTGGFRLEGGLKDVRNILNVGADLGHPVPMPTIALAKEHMERAQELGGQDLDWSSLSAAVREKANLKPFKKDLEKK